MEFYEAFYLYYILWQLFNPCPQPLPSLTCYYTCTNVSANCTGIATAKNSDTQLQRQTNSRKLSIRYSHKIWYGYTIFFLLNIYNHGRRSYGGSCPPLPLTDGCSAGLLSPIYFLIGTNSLLNFSVLAYLLM